MLISFEGGDRCGKTTQIELLRKKISDSNVKVVSLKHPDRSTSSGKIIDEYLKKKLELSNEAITLCLTSNLWESSEVIDKLLSEGYTVLIDRYIHTNLAYSQGIELKKLEAMMEGIAKPDLVIYLRTEDQLGIAGRQDFGNERYETIDIQTRVTRNFDKLFSDKAPRDFKVEIINSSRIIEDISKDIWDAVNSL